MNESRDINETRWLLISGLFLFFYQAREKITIQLPNTIVMVSYLIKYQKQPIRDMKILHFNILFIYIWLLQYHLILKNLLFISYHDLENTVLKI